MKTLLIGALLLSSGQNETDTKGIKHSPAPEKSAGAGAEAQPTPFQVPVGPKLFLEMPRDEKLSYRANISVAFVDSTVGEVVQVSKVEPYKRSVLLPTKGSGAAQEQATMEIVAKGGYALYELKTKISSRHLPQGWPAITYNYESTGSKRRRRQNLIGMRDGKPASSSRRDTSRGAPEGARIWKEPRYREIPENTIDMLSAVLMTRTLIRDGLDELRFPMVEKDRLWEVVLSRGEQKRMRTPAGEFDVIEVLLQPGPYPDEEFAEEKVRKFEGLFGIHGTIHLWVEKHTGVPVRIQGDIPAGPVTLGVDVLLKSYEGTPADFTPVKGAG